MTSKGQEIRKASVPILAVFGFVIFTVTCLSVCSRNFTPSQQLFNRQISNWIECADKFASLESARSYESITTYIQSSLHSTVQSPNSTEAYTKYLESPNVLQSIYYQIGNTSDFVIGAFEATEIPLPSQLSSDCTSNPLFAGVEISCLLAYTVTNSGRMIEGTLSSYSAADGATNLIYDLATYSPASTSRVIALEFSIYNVNSGSVGIVKILFERSVHGMFVPSYDVTVVPAHFLYLGGTGSSSEWLLVVGQLLIGLAASIFLLIWFGNRLVSGTILKIPSIPEFLLIPTAALCIASFGLSFETALDYPLSSANLGAAYSVNLSEVASAFRNSNAINSVISVLLFGIIFTNFAPSFPRHLVLLTAILLVVMVQFAVVLNTGFPQMMSFNDSFMLLTRIGLRYVSKETFYNLASSGGFGFVVLLVTFAFILYWLTGLMIGALIDEHWSDSSLRENWAVKSWSTFFGKLTSAPSGEKKRDETELKPRSPSSARRSSKLSPAAMRSETIALLEFSDKDLMTSVESMAGSALGKINQVRASLDTELDKAKDDLILVRRKLREVKKSVERI